MGVRGKRQGDPGAVKGKGSPVVSPARVEDSIVFDLPSAPFLTSSSGSPWGGGEVRNGADGSARRADAGRRGCRADFGAHSTRTPCHGPVRGLCGGCAGFPVPAGTESAGCCAVRYLPSAVSRPRSMRWQDVTAARRLGDGTPGRKRVTKL